MHAIADYFDEISTAWGSAWNRFWFTPVDPTSVSRLRILTGLLACWYFLSFSADRTIWFGPDGLLPVEMLRQLAEDQSTGWNGRASLLLLTNDPRAHTAIHVIGLLASLAFAIGVFTKLSCVVALATVLSYIHRGPMIMGQFEPVLTLLLFYLCFAPCNRRFSLDRWLRDKRQEESPSLGKPTSDESIAANISQRLIQVHVAALYLMMGLTKLGGSDWWNGEAIWWLIAHTESRLVDLTFLHRQGYLINLWTHAVVLFELSFGLLIWHRLARPVLLGLAVVHWLTLGLITGLLSFSAIMLVASSSFVGGPYSRQRARL